VHCSACDTWSTRADRCSNCGALPGARGGTDGTVSPPAIADPYAPAAAPAWDPYAPPAPATEARPGVYPGAPWQFGAQPPYGAPGGHPATSHPAWLPRPFGGLRGLATALNVLLPLSAVLAVLSAVAFFHRADVLGKLADAGRWGVTDSLETKAEGSDALVTAASALLGVSMAAAGVVFVVWMYRARSNVDLFGPSRQHLSAGWTIGGWLLPLANLWFPKLIMHDVWRASDPRTAERGGRTPGRLPILWTWWVLFVGSAVLFFAARLSSPMGDDIELGDADRLRMVDVLSGAATLALVPAAIAAFLVVRRITTFQHDREAMALASGLVPGGAPAPWDAHRGQAPTGQFFAMPPQQTWAGPPVPQAPWATTPTGTPPRPAEAPTAGTAPEGAEAQPPVSLAKPAPPAADPAAPAEAAKPDAAAVAEAESAGRPESEPEPAPDAEPEPTSEAAPESEAEAKSESDSEADAGPEADSPPAPDAEAAPLTELPTKATQSTESIESADRPAVPPTRVAVPEESPEAAGPPHEEADSIAGGERRS